MNHFKLYPKQNITTAKVSTIIINHNGVESNMLVSEHINSKTMHLLGIKRKDKNDWHPKLKLEHDLNILNGKDVQDSTFYRFPKIDLPRIKLDLLKEKYNIKITRDADKADYKIISKKNIRSCYEPSYYSNSILTRNEYLSFVQSCADANLLSKSVKDKLENAGGELFYVELRYRYTTAWRTLYDKISDKLRQRPMAHIEDLLKKDHSALQEDEYKWYTLTNKEAFESILNDTNLVLDEDMLKICNEDSVIIDEDQFKSILGMIKSNDADNIAIALEIMANCNIEESKAALGYIYGFYREWLKQGKNWNHINVKTMKKSLSNYEVYGRLDSGHIYSRFINSCLQDNSLNEMVFKTIAEDVFNNVILSNFNHNCPFEFTIEDIKLKPEIKSDLPF